MTRTSAVCAVAELALRRAELEIDVAAGDDVVEDDRDRNRASLCAVQTAQAQEDIGPGLHALARIARAGGVRRIHSWLGGEADQIDSESAGRRSDGSLGRLEVEQVRDDERVGPRRDDVAEQVDDAGEADGVVDQIVE